MHELFQKCTCWTACQALIRHLDRLARWRLQIQTQREVWSPQCQLSPRTSCAWRATACRDARWGPWWPVLSSPGWLPSGETPPLAGLSLGPTPTPPPRSRPGRRGCGLPSYREQMIPLGVSSPNVSVPPALPRLPNSLRADGRSRGRLVRTEAPSTATSDWLPDAPSWPSHPAGDRGLALPAPSPGATADSLPRVRKWEPL